MEIRITNQKFLINDVNAYLLADIRYRNKTRSLYFSVAEKYKDFICQDISPFVASVFVGALKQHASIVADGELNCLVSANAPKISRLYQLWNMGYGEGSVLAKSLKEDSTERHAVGCFFSGGVDSFYSYLKNLNESQEKITHFIFVHGFDIDLRNKELLETTLDNIRSTAKEVGIEVILVKTNLREITDPLIDWSWTFGSALGAVALFLRNGFKTIYIPSSVSQDELYPWGSHPDLDPLWSTEKTTLIHDGIEATRFEKIEKYVGHSPLAAKYLRVCFLNTKGTYNCGTCAKCLRTMIDLSIVESLKKSQTFPNKIDIRKVRMLDTRALSSKLFLKRSLKELEARNKDLELQTALKQALAHRLSPSLKTKARDFIGMLDHRFNKDRLYKFLSRKGFLN